MRWICVLLVAGCAGGHYQVGREATTDVQAVMRSGVGGEAALLAGEDAYVLSEDALQEERRALLDALAAKKVYHGVPRDETGEFFEALNARDRAALEKYRKYFDPFDFDRMLREPGGAPQAWQSTGVRRFHGQRILEIEYPDGVLRIGRLRGMRDIPTRYVVDYTNGRFGSKAVVFKRIHVYGDATVDAAWRGIEAGVDRGWEWSIPLDGSGSREVDLLGDMRAMVGRHEIGDIISYEEK